MLAAGAALASPFRVRAAAPPRVFPAGAPAAILVWSVRPEALLGWPRRLQPAQLAFLPPSAARLPTLGMLTAGGPAAGLEGVAALRPDLILDYGDLGPGYSALASRANSRLPTPYAVLDGELASIPDALRRTGERLAARERADRLASAAEGVLTRWSALRGRAGPSFFYARGADGLETGLAGSLATEVLEGAGWRNVVPTRRDGLGRVNLEQVAAWDPEVVVTLDGGWARRAAAHPVWGRRRSGRPRRVVALADAPFGWLDRPPSINRLLGCVWVSSPDPLGGGNRADLLRRVAGFHALFYGRTPTAAQLATLAPVVLNA